MSEFDPLDIEAHKRSLQFGYEEPQEDYSELLTPAPEAVTALMESGRFVGTYTDLEDFGWDLWASEGQAEMLRSVPAELLAFLQVDIASFTKHYGAEYDIHQNSEGVYFVFRPVDKSE